VSRPHHADERIQGAATLADALRLPLDLGGNPIHRKGIGSDGKSGEGHQGSIASG
jgi:hypothetical protein